MPSQKRTTPFETRLAKCPSMFPPSSAPTSQGSKVTTIGTATGTNHPTPQGDLMGLTVTAAKAPGRLIFTVRKIDPTKLGLLPTLPPSRPSAAGLGLGCSSSSYFSGAIANQSQPAQGRGRFIAHCQEDEDLFTDVYGDDLLLTTSAQPKNEISICFHDSLFKC